MPPPAVTPARERTEAHLDWEMPRPRRNKSRARLEKKRSRPATFVSRARKCGAEAGLVPAEYKRDSFGVLAGRIVAVDYG